MQFGFLDEPKRKSIKLSVKREVYTRAKGKCESCGIKLSMSHGDFHHFRSPSISPTAKTVQFLCPTCHRKYGHKRKTVTHNKGYIIEEKELVIKRKKAPIKRKSRTKKKKRKSKKTSKKKATRKRKTTRKKIKRRKTPKRKKVRKRSTKKKTKRRRKK